MSPGPARGARAATVRLVASVAAVRLTGSAALIAQAIPRAMYVSVLNDAGAPVPDLGPQDFVVREDNVAREVLKVEPATDPMQVALLVDNSAASRDAISDLRKGLHEFVT